MPRIVYAGRAWGQWSGHCIFLRPESGMIEDWYLYYLA